MLLLLQKKFALIHEWPADAGHCARGISVGVFGGIPKVDQTLLQRLIWVEFKIHKFTDEPI